MGVACGQGPRGPAKPASCGRTCAGSDSRPSFPKSWRGEWPEREGWPQSQGSSWLPAGRLPLPASGSSRARWEKWPGASRLSQHAAPRGEVHAHAGELPRRPRQSLPTPPPPHCEKRDVCTLDNQPLTPSSQLMESPMALIMSTSITAAAMPSRPTLSRQTPSSKLAEPGSVSLKCEVPEGRDRLRPDPAALSPHCAHPPPKELPPLCSSCWAGKERCWPSATCLCLLRPQFSGRDPLWRAA